MQRLQSLFGSFIPSLSSVKKDKDNENKLIWLRNETKYGEGRVAITPQNAKKLLNAGYTLNVERSKQRCFDDIEYEKVGCTLVGTNSWIKEAPKDAYIVGLKELESKPDILKHRHIFFAHAFKGQNEAIPLLKRFIKGDGEILDLEFLVDSNGRRVAAFGVSAGKAGMAMGLLTWAAQILGEKVEEIQPWTSEYEMIAYVNRQLLRALSKDRNVTLPRVIIIGALGRCGRGAVEIAEACGIETISKWDLAETKKGGPFPSIVTEHEIFVNCIRLMGTPFPPFITKELCNDKNRTLTVVSDIACDPNNPKNPIPIYDESTPLTEPVKNVIEGSYYTKPLDVTAIDHLPSLLPVSSSNEYSDALLPTLMELKDYEKSDVWKRAKESYLTAIKEINL